MPTESQIIASLNQQLPELLPALDVEVQRPRREDAWDLALKVRAAGTTRRVISAKDFPNTRAPLGKLQSLVELSFIDDKGQCALDRFGLRFGTENRFCAIELALIES